MQRRTLHNLLLVLAVLLLLIGVLSQLFLGMEATESPAPADGTTLNPPG